MRGPRTAIKSVPRLPQLEEALAQKRRLNTAKNLKKTKTKTKTIDHIEMEQDPMVLAPHVLSLPFVCEKV